MRVVSLLILLHYFTSHTFAACTIESINEKIAKSNVLANFTQSKTINGLSRPLISKGIIWMRSTGELIWQTTLPIKSTMVIRESGIKLFNKNDVLLPENKYPLAKDISRLFLSILGGDVKKLEDNFVQNVNCKDSSWQVDLQPENKTLSGIIETIRLSGSDEIESIGFQEKRGDKTEIKLLKQEVITAKELEIYLEH